MKCSRLNSPCFIFPLPDYASNLNPIEFLFCHNWIWVDIDFIFFQNDVPREMPRDFFYLFVVVHQGHFLAQVDKRGRERKPRRGKCISSSSYEVEWFHIWKMNMGLIFLNEKFPNSCAKNFCNYDKFFLAGI